MKSLSIIFSNTFSVIKKNKLLFVMLIILQIVALSLLTLIAVKYQLNIFEDLNGVLEPLNNANYDQKKIESGQPLLSDVLPILQSYNKLKKHIKEFFLIILAYLLLVNGIFWVVTHSFFKKFKLIEIFNMWFKYLLIYLVAAGLFTVISSFFLKRGFNFEALSDSLSNSLIWIGIFAFIIYYFLLVGITNINQKSWKDFFNSYKKVLSKIKSFLPLVMINLGLIVLIGYGIYRNSLSEQYYYNIFVLGFIGIFLIVLTRIFLIAEVKEIVK